MYLKMKYKIVTNYRKCKDIKANLIKEKTPSSSILSREDEQWWTVVQSVFGEVFIYYQNA